MEINDYSDIVLEAVGRDDSLVNYEEAEPFTTKVKTIDCSKAVKDLNHKYEGKVVLVTGGAGCIGSNKLFFYKETFTKERKLNTEVKR